MNFLHSQCPFLVFVFVYVLYMYIHSLFILVCRIWSHHDNRFLYMLLEYVSGGELFTYLRTAHRFDNPVALFFASEIVMALDYLHSLHIVYR